MVGKLRFPRHPPTFVTAELTLTTQPLSFDGMIVAILRRKEETAVAKLLCCRDLGMDCPKEVRAETEEELLKLAAEHAEKDHGISATMIPPSILAMVKSAIKDV